MAALIDYGHENVGDMDLLIADPDALSNLVKAAHRYDEALRVAGLRIHDQSETVRNHAYGDVYQARKQFRECIARFEQEAA